jgi:hypothetical protein
MSISATCPHCGKGWPAPAEITPVEEMLLFLVREMRADGASPSLEEMNFYFGYSASTRAALFRPISALVKKGLMAKSRLISSLVLTPLGEAAFAGRPLRSPGSRRLSQAANEGAA